MSNPGETNQPEASGDELRKQLDDFFDGYYDGGQSIVIPADESPTDGLVELVQAHIDAECKRARLEEAKLARRQFNDAIHDSDFIIANGDRIAQLSQLSLTAESGKE